MKKISRPMCVVCQEKKARIGKKDGFPADILCSQKCAANYFLQNCNDLELCKVCGEWTEVCGSCDV